MRKKFQSLQPIVGDKVRIIVAICTYNRNEALEHLLSTLNEVAHRCLSTISTGIVVVDDSADQQARKIVLPFEEKFELGVRYRHSGRRNISIARNLALETSLDTDADWIAMTDDDCEPSQKWLSELLRVQTLFEADVVTGPLIRRAPNQAPQWLKDQPFLQVTAFQADNGHQMNVAFTNNSMISAKLLRSNSDLRFDPDFGKIGGEDMVFFRKVSNRGAKIVFARDAIVFENEEPNRLTLSYQLRRHFWLGNSSVQTSIENGSPRSRMAVHALATLARAISRPVKRLANGERMENLYTAALICEALGKFGGVFGFKINHR